MNVHKNAKLTPAGRAELVQRVLFEKQSVPGSQSIDEGEELKPIA